MISSTSADRRRPGPPASGSGRTGAGVTMFTRSSVHCAERMVAASSSKGLRWSSAQSSRAVPGYSTASRSRVRRARPAGRARAALGGGGGRRRPSGGEGTHRYRGSRCATSRSPAPAGRAQLERVPTGGRSTCSGPRPTRLPPSTSSARRSTRSLAQGGGLAAALGAGRRRRGRRRQLGARPRARSGAAPAAPSAPGGRRRGPRRAPVRRRPGRGRVAGGQQPGLRLAPRAGRLDAGRPRGAAWPSRGSTPPGSCSTRSTGAWTGFCWTKVHRDERPAARRDLRDRASTPAAGGGPRPGADAGRPRPPPPARGIDRRDALRRRRPTSRPSPLRPPRLRPSTTPTAATRSRSRAAMTAAPHPLRRRPGRARRRSSTASPRYRVDQVWDGLYDQLADPGEMTASRRRCAPSSTTALPARARTGGRATSDGGETVKWLWALGDGTQVETVLMHYAERSTVCVSSQAGCAMACGFCATGQAGFDRHLTAGEIVEQVVRAARRAPRRRPPALQRRVHGDGRAARQLRRHLGGRRAAPRRPRAVGPPPHRVDGRHRPRHPPARRPRRCR